MGESKKGRPQSKHVSIRRPTKHGCMDTDGGAIVEIVGCCWGPEGKGEGEIGLIGECCPEISPVRPGHCFALAGGIHNCPPRNPSMRWNFQQGCVWDYDRHTQTNTPSVGKLKQSPRISKAKTTSSGAAFKLDKKLILGPHTL